MEVTNENLNFDKAALLSDCTGQESGHDTVDCLSNDNNKIVIDLQSEIDNKHRLQELERHCQTWLSCNQIVNGETENISLPPLWDFKETAVKLAAKWENATNNFHNFTKGCKWSPNGQYLITNNCDNQIRIFDNIPEMLATDSVDVNLHVAKQINEGDQIYDYTWSKDLEKPRFVTTSKDNPVHLWDACTAELIATYRTYNHMEEIESPISVSFNSTGDKLYCGFNNIFRTFQTDSPNVKFKECHTAKSAGLNGIISCFAFRQSNDGLFAVGSYSRTVGVFVENTCAFRLEGQQGGVTCLQFAPCGNKLYSGGRKDNDILCWDLRNTGDILYVLKRQVETNQRMYFDLDRSGTFLVSGNTNGQVTVWDTRGPLLKDEKSEESILPHCFTFNGHKDCVNGISIHPTLPLLATSSGQRKTQILASDDDSDTEYSDMNKVTADNSVRLWWLQ